MGGKRIDITAGLQWVANTWDPNDPDLAFKLVFDPDIHSGMTPAELIQRHNEWLKDKVIGDPQSPPGRYSIADDPVPAEKLKEWGLVGVYVRIKEGCL